MINEAKRKKMVENLNEVIAGHYTQIQQLQDEIKGYRADVDELIEIRDTLENLQLIYPN